MARKPNRLVAGEPIEPLLAALQRATATAEPAGDGMCRIECTFPPEEALALQRALMRIEAELLRNDARLLGTAHAVHRTGEQRGWDAFVVLGQRVAKTMTAQREDQRSSA